MLNRLAVGAAPFEYCIIRETVPNGKPFEVTSPRNDTKEEIPFPEDPSVGDRDTVHFKVDERRD